MHMYNFLCSDSLLYFFLFLSTLHSVYTRDCSCTLNINICWAKYGFAQSMDCATQTMDPYFVWAIHGKYGMPTPFGSLLTAVRKHVPCTRDTRKRSEILTLYGNNRIIYGLT